MAASDQTVRRDYRLRRANAIALTVLAVAAAGGLLQAAGARQWVGWDIPVDPNRLERAQQRIDLNTADAASLRRLPDIGPERAAKIIAFRQATSASRPFDRPEDIMNVPTIKNAVFEQVQPYLK